jgi:uncharacterized phage protein (TIGR02216 family)
MAAGLGLLRLRPADFWSMTPRELEAALRGLLGPAQLDAPLPRAALAQLMCRYPDVSSSGLSRGSSHPRVPSRSR